MSLSTTLKDTLTAKNVLDTCFWDAETDNEHPALGVLKTLAFLDANYLKPLVILKSSSLGEHSFCTVIYISWVSLGTSGRDEETNSN